MSIILTPSQIRFGCALPRDYMLLKEIKELLLYDSNSKRVRWQELINLEIADIKSSYSKSNIYLRRGSRWNEFYDSYGLKDTINGCEFVDIKKFIDELF